MDDLRINARWLIRMHSERAELEEHKAVFIQAGKISAIEDETSLREAQHTLDLKHDVLMPGFVNAHGHAAMSLLRGYADDLPLMTWLNEHIWPAEGRFVNSEFVYQGTELAIAEMLKSGTTTYADMYFYTADGAHAAEHCGMRSVNFSSILEFPTNYANNANSYLEHALAVHQQFKHSELITIGLGPHAPYTVSDAVFQQVTELAQAHSLPIQVHLHETAHEVAESLNTYGVRPIQRLEELGFFNSNVSCVHMTQINADDIRTLQQSGAHVVHCPKSNLKLASGFSPIAKLHQSGINLALGTDGAASNNDLNLQSEMRLAALLAKAVADDAAVISASDALYMATLGGAKALGISQHTGSLEVGKWADMQSINLEALEQQPLHQPISQLVYTESSRHTRHVWVAGKALVENGQLMTLDEEKIRYNAKLWATRLAH